MFTKPNITICTCEHYFNVFFLEVAGRVMLDIEELPALDHLISLQFLETALSRYFIPLKYWVSKELRSKEHTQRKDKCLLTLSDISTYMLQVLL